MRINKCTRNHSNANTTYTHTRISHKRACDSCWRWIRACLGCVNARCVRQQQRQHADAERARNSPRHKSRHHGPQMCLRRSAGAHACECEHDADDRERETVAKLWPITQRIDSRAALIQQHSVMRQHATRIQYGNKNVISICVV